MFYAVLLWLHIGAGILTLLSAAGAMGTKIFTLPHSWHQISGRFFYYAMVVVFVTSVVMTLLRPNLFLFLIAVFSFYLTFIGWRTAINRSGIAGLQERAAVIIMAVTGIGMISTGIYYLVQQYDQGITLLVFGGIGLMLSVSQMVRHHHRVTGKSRISSHIGHMSGATIAAVTAFLVTNIQTDPEWLAWIAPTIVLTPVSFWLIGKRSRKVKGSKV